jgi:hypothetical protein
VRAWYAERFRAWLVDLRGDGEAVLDRPLRFDRRQDGPWLDLRKGGVPSIRYGAERRDTLRLRVHGGGWDVDLAITPSSDPFRRTEDQGRAWYGVCAHVHDHVRGRVRVGGHDRAIDTTRGYTDHCWGRVPRKTGWHWLAAQDERVAVDSLVNHGPYAQRYTVAFVDGRRHVLADPVFEVDRAAPSRPWRVVSPDLDLTARALRVHRGHVVVPPLVDVRHDERVVEVTGRVRVDARWVEVGPLTGVTEAHHGVW